MRKKVKLVYITSNAARKAMYKKKKEGLIKKMSEMRTLCDVDASAIIYSPDHAQPEVYPSLTKLRQMKEMEEEECFLRQCIAKANEELQKQRKENREKEITLLMFQAQMEPNNLQSVSLPDLIDLSWVIDQHLKDIDQRMEKLNLGLTQDQEDCQPPIFAVQVEATAAARESVGQQDAMFSDKKEGYSALLGRMDM
ncbi:hypothetical protein TIFTF001_014982 [Ficus carica]|uniref:MADS-box domain-containing protein n=1 Tax=Ficus carica TaxID=3494 RepID=A0AA87ZXU9_FICCA|nr:hypothetical protein TIFTF001_014982 [Ficus carica]